MDITKCDNCKKKKTDKNRSEWASVMISGPGLEYIHFDFCGKCATKIVDKFWHSFKINKKST